MASCFTLFPHVCILLIVLVSQVDNLSGSVVQNSTKESTAFLAVSVTLSLSSILHLIIVPSAYPNPYAILPGNSDKKFITVFIIFTAFVCIVFTKLLNQLDIELTILLNVFEIHVVIPFHISLALSDIACFIPNIKSPTAIIMSPAIFLILDPKCLNKLPISLKAPFQSPLSISPIILKVSLK